MGHRPRTGRNELKATWNIRRCSFGANRLSLGADRFFIAATPIDLAKTSDQWNSRCGSLQLR